VKLSEKSRGVTEMTHLAFGRTISSAIAAVCLLACATTLPPKELVDARSAYERASKGPAAELAPAQLDTAKQALAKAEKSFEDEGDDPITKDLAYIAERRTEIAEADAGRENAERTRSKSDKDFRENQLDALKSEKSTVQATKVEAAKTKAELEAERKARAEAEKKATEAEKKLAAAMDSLQQIAKVKEEARGVVITLSGSVLFATGKSELLPIAKQKIDEVAKALKDQGYKGLLVEGHTDSQGSASKNQELSQARADSVRVQLISNGIPADKIRAQGLGSNRPVADNNTAEGRANNRRVEIVVEPLGK
jgi:outer membrane protein OmpA-like peptidoglycan-associated protein